MSEEVDPCHDCGHVRGPHRPGCSCSCHRTGYLTDQPEPLPAHEREVRAYAADSGDVVLRRHLTAVLAEYDRRGEEIEEMREKLRDIELLAEERRERRGQRDE